MQDNPFGKQLSFFEVILLVLAILLFLLAGSLHRSTEKPKINIYKQDSAVNINRNLLKLINIGNKRLIANLLWIQTLLEGDEEHYSKLDLNSWMYHRFMTIAEMDPLFYENYLHGGMYLSIVKDDPLGAAELFEIGLKFYPEDYRLNYNAGYNYVFELDQNKKGLFFLEKIMNDPKNPVFFPSIINKLRYEVYGNYEASLLFLRSRITQTKDPNLQRKIKEEIYAIKAETDLYCLNTKKQNCSLIDEQGHPYVRDKNGKWTAVKKFKLFRIGKQKNIK
jgi:hypothetical protein